MQTPAGGLVRTPGRRRLCTATHLPPTCLHTAEPKILGVVVISLAPVWGWSVFVTLCVGCYVTWAEPAGAPSISNRGSAWDLVFTLTSFALSLLLLFKTNSRCACPRCGGSKCTCNAPTRVRTSAVVSPALQQSLPLPTSLPTSLPLPAEAACCSYGRWWEARTLWGAGYIETRSFLRLVRTECWGSRWWSAAVCGG